jgi:signal transduction histidine kinase
MHASTDEIADESRHKCLIYDGHPAEQLGVVVPLLVDGLRDNWRCLYLGDPETVDLVDDALVRRGIDTKEAAARGALVLSSDRSHLNADGSFDPGALVEGLTASIDEAVRSGFGGLCASGDMRWELGADENFERLVEYEARLERLFRSKPLRGLCQYRRDILPARAIRDALVTHRSTYIGGSLNRDNLFYVPPELWLDGQGRFPEAQGEWMCQQIIRVLDAERKRDLALAAIEDLNRDLEVRIRDRTAELEIANQQLEAFVSSASHDLRAPLRAITGFCGVISEDFADLLGAEGRAQFERITDNAHRMSELIDAMLALSHAAKAPLHTTSIDLSRVARDIIADLAAADRSRTVAVEIHDGLRVKGDRALVRAAMTNLLSNAWKFTSKRTAARIVVGDAGGEGTNRVIFVRDNGAGFDMAQASKLFGAFLRLHHDADFPGHGVGLATVERIASRHGGRAWAEGRVGEGATFYLALPEPTSATAPDPGCV